MRAVIQHLRIPFSLLLLPIFLFAVSEAPIQSISNWTHFWILLFIIHVFIYPSSNAYNSLQDKDEGSIGLVEKPLPTPPALHTICWVLDGLASLIALIYLPRLTAILLIVYIIASRLYSYRKIRLKQYAIVGFATVFVLQGAVMYIASSVTFTGNYNIIMAIVASMLIGSMYPLSQIYQHKQDATDGVHTISMLLGYRGTFIFSGLLFGIGAALLSKHYLDANRMNALIIFGLGALPVLLFFIYWFYKVSQNTNEANYRNTMLMNIVSCICLNFVFLWIAINKY